MDPNEKRINTIFQTLGTLYPHAHIALTYTTPWELLVAVMLSAQCTDIMVNKVTKRLFDIYPSITDYAKANIQVFQQDIRSTGFYHTKAKHIIAAAQMVLHTFNGQVPKTMNELLTIPGVARKTANVVLSNAYNNIVGIAVDTHVIRLSQRLRLVSLDAIGGKKVFTFQKNNQSIIDFKKDADPIKIEKELMRIIPKTKWKITTYMLIDHGRAVCKAQRPSCNTCSLAIYCPASRI